MKSLSLVSLVLLFCSMVRSTAAQGVSDTPQTLQWVERQSARIDSLLHDVMRGSEPVEIFVRLTVCYQIFDAVAHAGLYCTEVRAAADAGRWQCDVINYRLEKDLNNFLQRAIEARRQGTRMREAARYCQEKIVEVVPAKVFTPNDVLLNDAHMVALDLTDGLATEDLHIMSQKLEHSIRLLYGIKQLASLLAHCNQPMIWADKALDHCQAALLAPNWLEVHRAVRAALSDVESIRASASCD